MATFPDLTLEMALADNPTATVSTWTDMSADLLGVSTKRGRQWELGRIETGTASATLSNQARKYDPKNSSGPYFGNLKRMRRARIRATWDGTSYPIFAGYVEKWPQTWQANGKVAVTSIPLVDGFAALSLARLNSSFTAQNSGARVNEVLDDINWGSGQPWLLDSASYSQLNTTTILGPVGDRAVTVGASTLQAGVVTNTSALNHLQDVADTEQGALFMSADGAVTFIGRYLLMGPPYTESQATFGDGAGELDYADLQLDDETPIYNDVRLARVGGFEKTASDSASQAAYFVRTYSKTNLLHLLGAEVEDLANYLVSQYKEPALRVRSILIKPQSDPTNLWRQVLGREIGDRVTVRRRPPGGGSMIEQQSIIEGIEHTIAPQSWQTRWWLSPADTNTFWFLDDATRSVLGTSTRLAY